MAGPYSALCGTDTRKVQPESLTRLKNAVPDTPESVTPSAKPCSCAASRSSSSGRTARPTYFSASTLRAATAFILLYVGIFVAGAGVIALDAAFQGPDLTPIDAIAAAATTLGNVGPGLGVAGPIGSFQEFSDVSTVTMTILMWLGRLEVIPVLVLATRRYWRV